MIISWRNTSARCLSLFLLWLVCLEHRTYKFYVIVGSLPLSIGTFRVNNMERILNSYSINLRWNNLLHFTVEFTLVMATVLLFVNRRAVSSSPSLCGFSLGQPLFCPISSCVVVLSIPSNLMFWSAFNRVLKSVGLTTHVWTRWPASVTSLDVVGLYRHLSASDDWLMYPLVQ